MNRTATSVLDMPHKRLSSVANDDDETGPNDFRHSPQIEYTNNHQWDPMLPGQTDEERARCRQQAQNIDLAELVERRAQVAAEMLRLQLLVLEHPVVRRIKDTTHTNSNKCRPVAHGFDSDSMLRQEQWIKQQLEQRNQVYIYNALSKGAVPELFSGAGGPSTVAYALADLKNNT